MRRITRYVTAILAAGLVTSCSSGTAGSPTPQPVTSALVTALSGVAPAALGKTGDFEFGDTVRLRALAADDKNDWGQLPYAGSGSLASYGAVIKDVLGIDLPAATSALTVGAPPATLVVIRGGQNAAAITAAATKAGWSGSGTLTRSLDLSTSGSTPAALIISAPKIRPAGSDVTVGGASADLSLAGSTPGADKGAAIAAGITCLGDVVTAQGTGFSAGAGATAVGVRAASGRITSVICLGAANADQATALADRVRTELTSGQSRQTRRPWTELLPNAAVDTVSGTPAMVRITADTTGQNPRLVQNMLLQRDLPGAG